MMKKRLLVFTTAITLVLASCTSDELVNNPGNPDNTTGNTEIGFRTLTDKGSSYATITNGDNILSFTVSGWWDKNKSNSIGSNDPEIGTFLFNGFNIARGEGSDWSYEPPRFWPLSGNVDFYAYSPASSKNVTGGLTDYGSKGDTICYTVPYNISDKEPQEDFLVARLLDQDYTTGKVILTFHHALSRIKFYAKTSNTQVTYLIDKVELLNLYASGELDMNNGMITESGKLDYTVTTDFPWVPKGNKDSIVADMGNSPVYLLGEHSSVLGATNALMVLPQTTDLGEKADDNGSDNNFYIKVSYKAFLGNTYYAGSKDESAVKYFPVKDVDGSNNPITFEMGRQYNFYLSFGEEVGSAIEFDVKVSDWTDEMGVLIPQLDNYADFLSPEIRDIADKSSPKDGIVTYAELAAVKNITFDNKSTATALTGFEYLFNLTSVTISVNKNVGNNLKLYSTNAGLTSITFQYETYTVETLDVSVLPAKEVTFRSENSTTLTINKLIRRADQEMNKVMEGDGTITVTTEYDPDGNLL